MDQNPRSASRQCSQDSDPSSKLLTISSVLILLSSLLLAHSAPCSRTFAIRDFSDSALNQALSLILSARVASRRALRYSPRLLVPCASLLTGNPSTTTSGSSFNSSRFLKYSSS